MRARGEVMKAGQQDSNNGHWTTAAELSYYTLLLITTYNYVYYQLPKG